MMTVREALRRASADLHSSPTPSLDSAVLLSHVLGWSRTSLMTQDDTVLTLAQQTQFNALVQHRIQGEPVAYLLGHREFWSLDLEVSCATLIPRPETERLVELVLAQTDPLSTLQVVDLGTGSGAIALALASERPQWQLFAVDDRKEALQMAQRNAQRLQLTNVSFWEGHWYLALPPEARFDVIVSNPPYIADQDPHLMQGDVRFEPRHALTAGPEGLDALAYLIEEAPQWLKPGGWLFLEHGYNQGAAVGRLLAQTGDFKGIQLFSDYGGNDRVTQAQLARSID